MDYALRLLRVLEHGEGDDIWEVLNMLGSRADRMEEKSIIWKVPFQVGKTFFRCKLLDAIQLLGPGELSCEQFLESKTNEVLTEYEGTSNNQATLIGANNAKNQTVAIPTGPIWS